MTNGSFTELFDIDPGDAEELRKLARSRTISAGKTVFLEGDPAVSVYGLSQGIVRLFRILREGRRQILGFALPGDLLEVPWAPTHQYFASALSDEVTFDLFGREEFDRVAMSSLSFARTLTDFATRELKIAQDHVLMLGSGSAEERLTRFIDSWRGRLQLSSMIIPLPMQRQDIADYLGLTIETVSRTFAKLEAKGFLRVVRRGVILKCAGHDDAHVE